MNKFSKTLATFVLISFALLRFPWILGDMPADTKGFILSSADNIIRFGVAAVLFLINPNAGKAKE